MTISILGSFSCIVFFKKKTSLRAHVDVITNLLADEINVVASPIRSRLYMLLFLAKFCFLPA